ncbi:MAG: GNAT family N-acetyltransferase [Gammaproteobacteria bacterium]|nr:GNAT family N-acetyltransferase [Gammaproteobacteria bacterium]
MVYIIEAKPTDSDIRRLIDELDDYQRKLYPDESNHLDSIEELVKPNVYFVAAYDDNSSKNQAIGCAAIKYSTEAQMEKYGEIKRLYVSESARGRGVSKQLISTLELHALNQNVLMVRLETGIYQLEAIGLYQKLGYQKISAFGPYSNEEPFSVFMEKEFI